MNDSCKPRKLDAGFATTCSKPSVFSTSTMKSEPGFSTVNESPSATSGAVSAASACAACDGDKGAAGDGASAVDCAAAGTAGAASAAAAAPRKNLRRSTREGDFAIRISELALRRQALEILCLVASVALAEPRGALATASAHQGVTANINSRNRWFTPEFASHGTKVPHPPRFVTTKFRLGMKMT